MITLQILIGLFIKKVESIHDYVQIQFSDGTILNVYNHHQYNAGPPKAIKGKKVVSVEEGESKITISFEGGGAFSIGMSDDDYRGPEAMVLCVDGKPPVVWN